MILIGNRKITGKNYEKKELGDEEIREREKSIELTPRGAQRPF
jgi:hypothetical protein